MSASREKKQRRDTDAPILSSRAQEEQAKAEKRKRNTIVYSIIGAVVVILVAILLIWDSGVIQRNRAVATIDGEKVTAAQVIYYYNNNPIVQLAQTYYQIGYTSYPYSPLLSPKDQVISEDTASQLGLDEEYVGQTFHDYFLDYALDSLRQEFSLRAAAKEAGYTLSDEGKEAVEQAFDSLDSSRDSYLSTYGVNMSRTTYLQMLYGDLMTARSYRSCLENAQLAQEFYSSEGFDSLTGYSDAELDAYYQENKNELDTFTYYWRNFSGLPETTKDEDGNTVTPTDEETEAAMEQAKADADAALAEIEADPDPANSVKENEDFTEATGVLSNPSAYYYDWLVDPDRQAGDAVVLTNGTGYSLLVFVDRRLDESPTVDVRHILISAMAEDDPDTEDVDESKENPTDEAYEEARQTALDLLDQWQANGGTEEAFAALAEEYSADSGSNTNGGLYEKVTEGSMIENFNDWIFDSSRASGDISDPIQNTVNDTKGWHLIYFVGWDEPAWETSARQAKWLDDLKTNVTIVRTDRLDSIFD